MARRRMDLNRRSNTVEENKLVLSDLRTRSKIEHRSHQELVKLFAKLNSDASSKHTKNSRISSGTIQEKIVTEHTYGPMEGFPVGCWWGIRMDCSRDRVHRPFNRDIEEGPFGAVSLCTSHLTANNDVDLGDSLTFTGGKYESGSQPDEPLVRSYRSQVPLRLVRSYNLTNEFAPKTGYRYDGLYTVAACWIAVGPESDENYKFALVRVRNQEPPTWRLAAGISNKLVNPAKKYSGPRTRCNIERFSTNLCSDTHPAVSEHETAGSSRSRTETAKYSLNKSSVSNGSDRILESKKISHDSTIVTRCISSKKIECSSSVVSSVSSVESPSQIAGRHLENTTRVPPPCKLQNTNISIRTDLYESYLHQDPVKATPMTFCRTFKTVRGPSHIVKNVGTLNLNSCGPCPRDREQESQIQSRSGAGKFSSTQSPSSESNRSADRGTPKIGRAVATPTDGKTSFDDQTGAIVDRIDDKSLDRPKSTSGERAKEKRLKPKQNDEENSMDETTNVAAKSSDEAVGKCESVCPIMRTSSKESVEAAAMSRDETSDEPTTKESHGAIDSLTPDQMLNFIVNQKCHPRAKLLIGSVIGLATGESTILRAYDSLISRQERWNRNKSLRDTRIDSPAGAQPQSVEPKFECRQTSSRTSRENDRSAPKGITKKIIMKERMLQMSLRRTRVSKRSLGKEKKKSITKPSESMSQRLRKSKTTDKSQQPFSKSTTLKTSTKRAKKRGGELARLVIDANIGPKIRGPRNRRLRGRTHIFAKKRHPTGEQDVSKCCGGNSSDVGLKGKKVNARVELSSRRSKRLSSAAKTRIPQSSRYIERKKNVRENERTPRSRYVERKKRERATDSRNLERSYDGDGASKLEARVANARAPSSGVAKRKMPRTRSSSRDQSSGESSKRPCFRSRNDSANRQSRMVDASTQCSDRRDAATSVEREICEADQPEAHENSLKVEWIDLDDVKSETHESVAEEPSDFDVDVRDAIENSIENREIETRPKNVLPIRPRATKPQVNVAQRLSAFVPVNLSDSDFRIARLRSIGFRPIEPAVLPTDKDPLQVHGDYDGNLVVGKSSKEPENSTVVSRIVDEQYNKYTSEETDVVEYMDQELRYQDIEDEEAGGVRKNRGKMSKNGPRIGKNKNMEDARSEKIDASKDRVDVSNEDDSEAPWHGWKKSVQNKQAHWTGW